MSISKLRQRNACHTANTLPCGDRDMLKLWPVVQHKPETTPVNTLHLEDHRVSSDHFEQNNHSQSNRREILGKNTFFFFCQRKMLFQEQRDKQQNNSEVKVLTWHQHTGKHSRIMSKKNIAVISQKCVPRTE